MLIDEIALTFVRKLGSKGVAHLIDLYKTAERVYSEPEFRLIICAELRDDIVAQIINKDGYAVAERELKYCEANGVKAISSNDPNYPARLREIPDRPHILYYMGNIEALSSPHILSIVGTRRMSSYGESICVRFVSDLAQMFPDLVIVSGMAFGIDATVHRVALAAGVRTVGVLANKLPDITPTQHRNLAKDIIDHGGAIITEVSSQTKQNGAFYIPRNRIIAGVSDGLFVVESPANGGSLSTVKAADAYSRTIMAVPGRVTDTRSEGTNHLIKTNVAQLVTSPRDIAEALGWEIADTMPEKMYYKPREANSKECAVLSLLADASDGLSLEAIANKTGMQIAETSAVLLNMELSGVVRQLPGKIYVIC